MKIITTEELTKMEITDILDLCRNKDNYVLKKNVLNWHKNNLKYPKGLLNAVTILAIRSKNGFIPPAQYLSKTLRTFVDNGSTTVRSASLRLEEYHEIKTSKPGAKKKAHMPDWLSEYITEIQNMEG